MCFNGDNLASVLVPSGIRMTRRHFTLGLGGAAALTGLLPFGGFFASTEVQAQLPLLRLSQNPFGAACRHRRRCAEID